MRQIAASAYRAGAPLVETIWGDEALQMARFRHAPRDSFGEFSAWLPDALSNMREAGHAVLSVYANDPDQLKDEPPELVSAVQQARRARSGRSASSFRETRPTGRSSPPRVQAGRRECFPTCRPAQHVARLWDAIAQARAGSIVRSRGRVGAAPRALCARDAIS